MPFWRWWNIKSFNISVVSLVYKSKELSDESIKPPATSDNSLSAGTLFSGTKLLLKFDGSCLKQEKSNFYSLNYNKCLYCLWNKSIVI